MARKNKEPEKKKVNTDGIMGLHGSTVEQAISETLEINYMPYAMSVIVSRAIPEIDGFKPSHRKLLYTMYKMGLLNGGRTKSANIVGQTMRLNPHGDAAIYETMVRLARGNETLLHPFVDSKGNFGKVYSRDMAYAASRYTEAKLDGICGEIFKDIDSDTVDMVDNYDATMKEPSLLPTTFPNVLVSANQGIAVGMASNICSFNLKEVCDTAVALMKNPDPGSGVAFGDGEVRKAVLPAGLKLFLIIIGSEGVVDEDFSLLVQPRQDDEVLAGGEVRFFVFQHNDHLPLLQRLPGERKVEVLLVGQVKGFRRQLQLLHIVQPLFVKVVHQLIGGVDPVGHVGRHHGKACQAASRGGDGAA